MIWKKTWFDKRKVKLVVVFANQRVGREVTWQELCDRKSNGHRCNGGFGANIYKKLLETGRLAHSMEGILFAVAGYSRQEAQETLKVLLKRQGGVGCDG
jgi:hypothetical protein